MVGDTSPLTANAMYSLGRTVALGGLKEGIPLLRGSLASRFQGRLPPRDGVGDLLLKDVHMDEAPLREAHPGRANNLAACRRSTRRTWRWCATRKRLTAEHERGELGTLAVWYKTVGEMAMLAQDYKYGEESSTRRCASSGRSTTSTASRSSRGASRSSASPSRTSATPRRQAARGARAAAAAAAAAGPAASAAGSTPAGAGSSS